MTGHVHTRTRRPNARSNLVGSLLSLELEVLHDLLLLEAQLHRHLLRFSIDLRNLRLGLLLEIGELALTNRPPLGERVLGRLHVTRALDARLLGVLFKVELHLVELVRERDRLHRELLLHHLVLLLGTHERLVAHLLRDVVRKRDILPAPEM